MTPRLYQFATLALIALWFALQPTAGTLQARPLGTEVSGAIGSDTTWTVAGSPYVVEGDLLIKAPLMIEAGVIVKMGLNARLNIWGPKLTINGTASQPVYITSINDKSVGGSTGDDDVAPASGDWACICIQGEAEIRYTEIRYGGALITPEYDEWGAYGVNVSSNFPTIYVSGNHYGDSRLTLDHVTLGNGAVGIHAAATHVGQLRRGTTYVTITHSIIEGFSDIGVKVGGYLPFNPGDHFLHIRNSTIHSSNYGLQLRNADLQSHGNVIAHNRYGLYLEHVTGTLIDNLIYDNEIGVITRSPSHTEIPVEMNQNSILGNRQYGVLMDLVANQLDARRTWWGHATGPRHATNPTGQGDRVSDGVLFEPWLTRSPGLISETEFVIQPVWPPSHNIDSEVMLGGKVYRYFRLTTTDGEPVAGAMVKFSAPHNPELRVSITNTDINGLVVWHGTADLVDPVAEYTVSEIRHHNQSIPIHDGPQFRLQTHKRDVSHSWRFGTQMEAGLTPKIPIYVGTRRDGGLEIEFEETCPTGSETITIASSHGHELAVGLSATAGFEAQKIVAQINSGASLEATIYGRVQNTLQTQYLGPFTASQLETQGAMLLYSLFSIPATELGGLVQPAPLSRVQLSKALTHLGLIQIDSIETALGINFEAEASTNLLDISFGINDNLEWVPLQIDLAKFEAGGAILIGYEQHQNGRQRLIFEVTGDVKTKLMNTEAIFIDTSLPAWLQIDKSERMGKITIELSLDPNHALDEIKLIVYTRLPQPLYSPTVEQRYNFYQLDYIIRPDKLDSSVLRDAEYIKWLLYMAGLGSSPGGTMYATSSMALEHFIELLLNTEEAAFQISYGDATIVKVDPGLKLKAKVFKVKGEVELEQQILRTYLKARGAVLNGTEYTTEYYEDLSCIQTPSKDWQVIAENALEAFFSVIIDTIHQLVVDLNDSTPHMLEIVDYAHQKIGQFMIVSPPTIAAASAPTSVEVTIFGWDPVAFNPNNVLNLTAQELSLAGQTFTVGGVYALDPDTLTLDRPATIQIAYTDWALQGIDEANLRMFRWNRSSSNWQPISAHADLDQNQFSTEIAQLGTFALGYDYIAPEITIFQPNRDDGDFSLPLTIRAQIVDSGVGIEPASISLHINDQVVPASYSQQDGLLSYTLVGPIDGSSVQIRINAADTVGNTSEVEHLLGTTDDSHTPVATPTSPPIATQTVSPTAIASVQPSMIPPEDTPVTVIPPTRTTIGTPYIPISTIVLTPTPMDGPEDQTHTPTPLTPTPAPTPTPNPTAESGSVEHHIFLPVIRR